MVVMMMMMMMMMIPVAQEELERDWKRTARNGPIAEENDDYEDDEGETIYRGRQIRYDDVAKFRNYDDDDQEAAVKIQSNFRGYRSRKQLPNRQH